MKLSDLAPAKGAKTTRKRVGRGVGSGTGKTSGRGSKGQKSRSGAKQRAWFEGGQMPLQRRVPKRGFHNLFRKEYQLVSLSRLNDFPEGEEITRQTLVEAGVLNKKNKPVKVLANGNLEKKLTIKLHAASAKAKEQIESAGGTFEVVK